MCVCAYAAHSFRSPGVGVFVLFVSVVDFCCLFLLFVSVVDFCCLFLLFVFVVWGFMVVGLGLRWIRV